MLNSAATGFECQSALAHASGAEKREDSRPVGEQLLDLVDLREPSDDRSDGHGRLGHRPSVHRLWR